MNVEEDYLDVLQNIEFAIVSVHQRHPRWWISRWKRRSTR